LTWIPRSREQDPITGETDRLDQDFLDWRDLEWVDGDEEFIIWAPASFFPAELIENMEAEEEGLGKYVVYSKFHHENPESSLSSFDEMNDNDELSDEYLCGLDYQLRVLARFGDPISMLRLAKMRIAEHGWNPGAGHLREANRWYWRADYITGSLYPDDPSLNEFIAREQRTIDGLVDGIYEAVKVLPAPDDGYEFPVCELHGLLEHRDESAPFSCKDQRKNKVKKPKKTKHARKGKDETSLLANHQAGANSFCTKCGSKRNHDDIFCGSCGNRFGRVESKTKSVSSQNDSGAPETWLFGMQVQLNGPLTEGDFAENFGATLDEFESDQEVYEYVGRVWDNQFFRVQYSGKSKHRDYRDSKPFGDFSEDEIIEDDQSGFWTDFEFDRSTGTYTYRMAKEISLQVRSRSEDEAREIVAKNAKRCFTIEDLDSGNSLSQVQSATVISLERL
jgi:hypothetical protein